MAELTVDEKSRLFDAILADTGGKVIKIDLTDDCRCELHNGLREAAARIKQSKAKDKALADGNRIEFTRLVREQIEREMEGERPDSPAAVTGRAILGMIAALEKGWEPVPDKDPTTIVEEYTLPAYDGLQDSVIKFLMEAFPSE